MLDKEIKHGLSYKKFIEDKHVNLLFLFTVMDHTIINSKTKILETTQDKCDF